MTNPLNGVGRPLAWGAIVAACLGAIAGANVWGRYAARLDSCERTLVHHAGDLKEIRVVRIIVERLAAERGISTEVNFGD